MKIYIAGASCEVGRIEANIVAAISAGLHITHDWTVSVRAAMAFGRTDTALSDAERFVFADVDRDGVLRADVLWLCVPPHGRSAGAWVELGIALGARIPVIVSGAYRDSIFTALAGTANLYDSDGAALAALIGMGAPLL